MTGEKKLAHEQWGTGVWKECLQDFGGKTRTQIRHYIEWGGGPDRVNPMSSSTPCVNHQVLNARTWRPEVPVEARQLGKTWWAGCSGGQSECDYNLRVERNGILDSFYTAVDFTARLTTLVGLGGRGEKLNRMTEKMPVNVKKTCKTKSCAPLANSSLPPLCQKVVVLILRTKCQSWTSLNFLYTLSSLTNNSTRNNMWDLGRGRVVVTHTYTHTHTLLPHTHNITIWKFP